MAGTIIDTILADIARGHSLRGASGHQRMSEKEVRDIIAADPELVLELEIAENQALYLVEETYIDEATKVSTRNLLIEMGVRAPDVWKNTPIARNAPSPDGSSPDDGPPQIAPDLTNSLDSRETH